MHPDCVLVIPIKFKSLFPDMGTFPPHLGTSAAQVELPLIGGPKFPVALIHFVWTVIFFIFQNI